MKKIVLSGILIFCIFQLYAQHGSVRGRVFNEKNNEPLPFANIVLFGTNTGTTSDIEGRFNFSGLKPGFIKLAATNIGYEAYVSEEFQVTNAKTVFIDIPMREASILLDQIVIQASMFRKTEESPVSMRTLGIRDIEKNPGANRDISKVIQTLPGVATTVSFRNDIIVRGGGPAENRFYLDGMEIPNLNHFATQGASGGPVGIINVDFIREVDFYSGAFPANRGNALSSILEMKQIDGNQERVVFKGSVGASDLSLALNGPIGKKTTFLFSARRSYLKFLFSIIGLPFLPTYNDFQFKVRTRIDQKNELTFLGIGAIDRFKLNTGIDNPTEEQQYILNYLPVNEQWNYAIGAVYKHYRTNSSDTWVFSRNMLNNGSFKFRDNDENMEKTLDYNSQEIENKFRFENSSRINAFKIISGAGGEYARFNTTTFQKVFIPMEEDTLNTLNYSSESDLFKYHIFSQVSHNFSNDRLILSLGLRMEGNSYSPDMSNLLNQLSPRFSAAWALTEKFFINFNTGRYFQQPAYTTLGFRNDSGDPVNKTNNLSYIASNHLVGGIEYHRKENARFTVEAFYKHYSDYPVSVRDSVSLANKGGDFGVSGNEEVTSTGTGRAYGLEVYLRDRFYDRVDVILSYTFVRSEFKDNSNKFIPSSWDNRHLINLTLSHEFKNNWDIGARWRYVGGSPYSPWDIERSSLIAAWDARNQGYLDYNNFNTKRTGSFHQLDVRVDKQYFFDKWSLNLYVDIQNLYNFKQKGAPNIVTQLDNAGNNLVDTADPSRYLVKEIANTSGTVLPTIGIIVEF